MSENELRNEIIEFQNIQQQLQLLGMQKQQIQVQVQDLEKALEELAKVPENKEVFRFIGSVFIPKTPSTLKKELAEEKEALELRKNGLLKQESKINERFSVLRKKIEAAQKGDAAALSG
jgi:prefoldin beta subunit